VCWPEQWLSVDMGYNVWILMLSYDACVDNKGDIFEIAKNLVQSLVTRYFIHLDVQVLIF
jgi:hypothetical protein